MKSKNTFVLFRESGCYSDYGMEILGVYSSHAEALKHIPNAVSREVEYWDGFIENEGEYVDSTDTDNYDDPHFTIQEYVVDAAPDNGQTPAYSDSKVPYPPTKFKQGTRVQSVKSKRTGVVVGVNNRDFEYPDYSDANGRTGTVTKWYRREMVVLPDDNSFIGRGVSPDGKLRVREEELELECLS